MDRLIYVAMTGAAHTLHQQATVAHNLANVSSAGFRAEVNSFRALPVYGPGAATRTFVLNSTTGSDFAPGVIQQTGRELDVAVQGKGWIAVRAPDGSEGYTRNGSLQLSPNGVLQTRGGLDVMGDGGTISIPPDTIVTIAKDGTISTVPSGSKPSSVVSIGRIKLVNPNEADLVRSGDGLFRLKDKSEAPADANVALISGAIEGSNVNAVEMMVNMINLARQFDLQMKLLQDASTNDRQANQILNLNA